MKYYWVKLSWMLITKVMHYLLINGSSLFWAKRCCKQVVDQCRDGEKKRSFQSVEVSRCVNMQKGKAEIRGGGAIVRRQTVVLSWLDTATHHKSLFRWSGWNENALFIYRSLIMNPPKAAWEVWRVQVKAFFFFFFFVLRIHIICPAFWPQSFLWFQSVMTVRTKKA